MQNNLHTACDMCAAVLEGKSGTAEMKKEYISVKGSLMFVTYNKDGKAVYTYAADKQNMLTPLHFCAKNPCLHDYMTARLAQKEEWFKNKNTDMGYGDYADA